MSGTVHGRTVSLEVYYAQDRLMLSTISRAERHRLRAFCSASIHSVFINPGKWCSNRFLSRVMKNFSSSKKIRLLFQFFLQNIYFRCVEYSFNFVRLIWRVDGILYSLWLIFFVSRKIISILKNYTLQVWERHENFSRKK